MTYSQCIPPKHSPTGRDNSAVTISTSQGGDVWCMDQCSGPILRMQDSANQLSFANMV